MGYRFQFVTLAGFHTLNLSMYELANDYARSGMTAYSRHQQREFDMADNHGYSAVKHQRFVGTGYFDAIASAVTVGQTSTCASTEAEQFDRDAVEYNDGEATERTPMPQLYPLLESMPLPSTAAND